MAITVGCLLAFIFFTCVWQLAATVPIPTCDGITSEVECIAECDCVRCVFNDTYAFCQDSNVCPEDHVAVKQNCTSRQLVWGLVFGTAMVMCFLFLVLEICRYRVDKCADSLWKRQASTTDEELAFIREEHASSAETSPEPTERTIVPLEEHSSRVVKPDM